MSRPNIVITLVALTFGAYSGNAAAQGGINAPNNQGIVTQGQIGNNTINQAPAPTFTIFGTLPTEREHDGTFTRHEVINVNAPYPPANIFVEAKGPTVIGVEASMLGTNFGAPGGSNGNYFYRLNSPFGKIQINIHTTDEITPVNLRVAFNQ